MGNLLAIFILIGVANIAQVHAEDTIEIFGGPSLTFHVIDPNIVVDSNFSNKVSSDGRLIANPLFGITYGHNDGRLFSSITGFLGEDSLGDLMEGAIYERGYQFKWLQLGLAGGGYIQNDVPYHNDNIAPFRLLEVDGLGLVPVVGAAVNLHFHINDRTYVFVNNVLTPVITNTTVGLGFSF